MSKKEMRNMNKLINRVMSYCNQSGSGNIADHCTFDVNDGSLVLQPYEIQMEQVEKLIELCHINDLKFVIDGWSEWNPKSKGPVRIKIKANQDSKYYEAFNYYKINKFNPVNHMVINS